jgi:hypothetical protein
VAKGKYATRDVPSYFVNFAGGLNSESGALNVAENESPDLQNVDFTTYGSVKQRNGYETLSASLGVDVECDGLYWLETVAIAGTTTRHAVNVSNGKLYKMDSLDGVWDNITSVTTSITAGEHCDFDTFTNVLIATNDVNPPFYWDGATVSAVMVQAPDLAKAKFVTHFQNYSVLANVEDTGGNRYASRFYWSTIKDITTWDAADYIDVAPNDGEIITGCKVLGDRLVIYKENSIYLVSFTGDRDIPFVVDKSNSSVGCIAPYSIQATKNGHVFLARDGMYLFDGQNSYKLSDRINTEYIGLNRTNIRNSVSMYQHDKNRYWVGVPTSGSSENDRVYTWDSQINAISRYDGLTLAACAIFNVNGNEERPYFGDYEGFTYRCDYGTDDYPLSVASAVDSYYYTNWKWYQDAVSIKDVPHCYLYYQTHDATLDFSYSYDLETGDQFNTDIDISDSGGEWDTMVWGVDNWAGQGGAQKRVDLTSEGRLVRFKFSSPRIAETWQIDGMGTEVGAETQR